MDRQRPISEDWFMLGLTTGVAASVAKSLVNLGLRQAGVPTVPYHTFAGGWVLGKKPWFQARVPGEPRTTGEKALGHVAETLYGGLFGIGIAYVLAHTPPGHESIKGAIGGAACWAFVTASLNQVARPRRFSGGQMATLLGMNLFYGALQGALIGRCRSAPADQPQRPSQPVLQAAPTISPRPLDEGLTSTLR